MRIYLDTNVFARLFDDRSHPTVEIEAQAALILFTLIESKKLTCLSSDILKLEIEHCSLPKRIRLQSLVCLCSQHVSENESIKFLKRSMKNVVLHQGMRCTLHQIVWVNQIFL